MLNLLPAERSSYLEQCCGADPALRSEVLSLVDASEAETSLGRQRSTQAHESVQVVARGRRIGPYAIDRLIGRGGMGSVYLAHRADGQFDQQIAIKLVDLPLTSELFRDRFRAERQILANLVHPFIARLLDGGMTETGELFLAMEYVDGISITQYCKRNALTLPDRLRLFLNVCSAVQFAHQNLVVHRDLKPDNILIAADGTPRLLDFGTAKLLQPLAADAAGGYTQHGIHPFTPDYASPEQVLGDPITTASDIYSLGVLLYLLLAEKPPYSITDFTTGEFLRVICTDEPQPPSAVAVGSAVRMDADLDAMVLKALRKEPRQRYASIEQFAADIDAYLLGRPVIARRGTYRYRAAKFIRRNRLPLTIASLLCVSLLVGAVAVLWQSHRADQQRRRAEARSEDLRQLSSSLLSEIDEAIKELPGSTPVQRLLVGQVLHHLDRMSTDAEGDAVASLDVIAAYTRLGNLQGNPYEQNIGEPAGAEASLRRAIDLARRLLAQRPHRAQALAELALAEQSLGEVLFGIGRTANAIDFMQAAVADYDARIALPGTGAQEFAEAASAAGALGDLFGQSGVSSTGDQEAALAAYGKAMNLSQRALDADPHFVRAMRGIAIDHMKIGNIRAITDPVRASQEYAESLAGWQSLPAAEQAAASTRRGIAQTHLKIADNAAALDDYARASREYELARPTLEYLAKADSDDSRVTYDLADFYYTQALLYVDQLCDDLLELRAADQAKAVRAATLLAQTVPIFEHLLTLEPGNRSWIANHAYAEAMLGSLQQRYGLGADGRQRAGAGFATLMEGAGHPDANIDVLQMAAAAGLSVLPQTLRDPPTTLKIAARLVSATRRRNPRHLLLLSLATRACGDPEAAAATAGEALALLTPVPPGADAPRLTRQLQRLAHGA